MKTSTVKLLRPALINRLLLAGITALVLVFTSCRKDEQLSYEEQLQKALQQTHFENHTGNISYLKNDDLWAIRFEPDLPPIPPGQGGYCYVGYIAIIDNPQNLSQEFKVDGIKVIFTGIISPSTTEPDMTGLDFLAGTEFKTLHLSSLKAN